MTIDPRLIERQKTVAEDNAKRNVERLLKFLIGLLLAGALIWLLFSPWLSIRQVSTTGISVSAAHSILSEMGVRAGTPMIRINETATEAALLDDPWIAEAEVSLGWPNEVSVTIVEREPVAWVETSEGWARRGVDGVALPSAESPDGEFGLVELRHLSGAPAQSSPELLGAVEFLAHLSPAVARDTTVTYRNGELWAAIRGHEVRLGREVEMREKAIGLEALLAKGIPEGSLIVLIAPTNPAVGGFSGVTDRDRAAEVSSGGQGQPNDGSVSEDVEGVGPEDD